MTREFLFSIMDKELINPICDYCLYLHENAKNGEIDLHISDVAWIQNKKKMKLNVWSYIKSYLENEAFQVISETEEQVKKHFEDLLYMAYEMAWNYPDNLFDEDNPPEKGPSCEDLLQVEISWNLTIQNDIEFITYNPVDYHGDEWEKEEEDKTETDKIIDQAVKNALNTFYNNKTKLYRDQILDKINTYQSIKGIELIEPFDDTLFFIGKDATNNHFANALDDTNWPTRICKAQLICRKKTGKVYGPGENDQLKKAVDQRHRT